MRSWRSILAGVVLALVVCPLIWAAPAQASDDAYSTRQWNLRRVGTEQAWQAGQGFSEGQGVVIAVVDTGVDLEHPDLAGAFVDGFDFVDNDPRADDEHGHGTHVAGIAAARSNNRRGVAGVAPGAKIMPIRVLDEDGRGSGSDVEAGVRWAVDHGADVINLSLSGGVVVEGLSGGTLTEIVDYAWSKGAVPVIAAGNGGLFRTDPSRARRLLVTATSRDDRLASYATSVGFADWGIAAPGGDATDAGDGNEGMVFSTLWDPVKGSGYGWAMGTSMAAPHVSGAAAILRGLGLDAPKTVERLLSTAEDIGSEGEDFNFGAGLVDIDAAVQGLAPPTARPSAPSASRAPREVEPPVSARVDAPQDTPSATVDVEIVAGSSPSPVATAPGARIAASDEISEKSAIANIVLAGSLLAGAGALVGYGGFRRIRGRPADRGA